MWRRFLHPVRVWYCPSSFWPPCRVLKRIHKKPMTSMRQHWELWFGTTCIHWKTAGTTSPFELIVPGVSSTFGPKLNLKILPTILTCGHEILGKKSSSFHLKLLRSWLEWIVASQKSEFTTWPCEVAALLQRLSGEVVSCWLLVPTIRGERWMYDDVCEKNHCKTNVQDLPYL